MSSDLVVQTVTAAHAVSGTAAEPRIATIGVPPQADPAAPPSPIVNPSLRLDPALGLVVIEFRDDAGAITTSIPSQRQLAAYQKWETTRLGPVPVGQVGAKPAAAQPPSAIHAHASGRPAVQTSATRKP